MRIRGHVRKLRGRAPLALGALLGAAVVVFPAVASSEAPRIEAVNGVGVYNEHRWMPSTAEVGTGAGVGFQNASATTPHGVQWTGGPETPTCSGVPINKGEVNWKGTCTFAHAGVYTFRCVVHPTEMTGSVTVTAIGSTTTTSYTYPPPAVGTTPAGSESAAGGTGQGATPLAYGLPSPLARSAASAVRLASIQRGRSVRGSVDLSQAGTGGRLEVDLLARSAALASNGAQASAGRLVLNALRAGNVSFAVPLNGRARSALRRHHRLALSARIQLQAPAASSLKITRSLLLRP
jgi:plastocyanin